MFTKCLLLCLFFCALGIECKPGNLNKSDYIHLNETGSFYKFHAKGSNSWNKAKSACEAEGATLFYPEDKDEVKVIRSQFPGPWGKRRIYIGIFKSNANSKSHTTKDFKTLDGRAMEDVYHSWSSGEPNNKNNKENCVIMYEDGFLNDIPCPEVHGYTDIPFICKIKGEHSSTTSEPSSTTSEPSSTTSAPSSTTSAPSSTTSEPSSTTSEPSSTTSAPSSTTSAPSSTTSAPSSTTSEPSTTTERTPDSFGSGDYTYLNETNFFYKFIDGSSVSWYEAKSKCEAEGATLFYPTTEVEAKAVLAHYPNHWNSWIPIGIAHPLVTSSGIYRPEFETVDGIPLESVYHEWRPGQPNNLNGNSHCLYMNRDGLLHDNSCFIKDIHYICKTTPAAMSAKEIAESRSNNFFRKGYTYLEATRSFYKLYTQRKTWRDAKKACELEGATFFYSQDEKEAMQVIANLVKEKLKNSAGTPNSIYIGVSTPNVPEVFETVDGTSLDDVYSNWGLGEPENRGGSAECVVMNIEGILYSAGCDTPYPFICKKTEASLRWNSVCNIPDPDYTYNNKTGRCYKLHLNPKNWTDAYATCRKEESRLPVINSDDDAKILVDLITKGPKDVIQKYHCDAMHLGFKFDVGTGTWRTANGGSIDFRDVPHGDCGRDQPDYLPTKSCGSMFYNGHLNNIDCATKSFFVCEHEVP